MLKKIKEFFNRTGLTLFVRELLSNPGAIGAACPSSKWLARCMAAQVPLQQNGMVVELGAGTGAITAALVKHGIPSQRIIVIERAPALTEHLRQRFPDMKIILGDARYLQTLLGDNASDVSCVVSSLPLRSLPDEVVNSITSQLSQLLNSGELFIQYTYNLLEKSAQISSDFQQVFARIIWNNLPPAKLLVYKRI